MHPGTFDETVFSLAYPFRLDTRGSIPLLFTVHLIVISSGVFQFYFRPQHYT